MLPFYSYFLRVFFLLLSRAIKVINSIRVLIYAKRSVGPNTLRIKCKFLIMVYQAFPLLTLSDFILYPSISQFLSPLTSTGPCFLLWQVKNASVSWIFLSILQIFGLLNLVWFGGHIQGYSGLTPDSICSEHIPNVLDGPYVALALNQSSSLYSLFQFSGPMLHLLKNLLFNMCIILTSILFFVNIFFID